ncbi:MAG: hypothetical protein EHM61_04240 [Acidobacteria bacterium]|nr:MAG: hypothetical protein EHM61_04240 [Acidobacteriota bacterium]
MPIHDYFRELAALAEVGEISEKEQAELQMHLRDCLQCRQSAQEYREVLFDWLPLSESAKLENDLRPGIRSFRSRAAWIMPIAALLVLAIAVSLVWTAGNWKEPAELRQAVETARSESVSLRIRLEEKDRRIQALERSLSDPGRTATTPPARDHSAQPPALEEARARVAQLQAEKDELRTAYSDIRQEQDRLSRELEQAKVTLRDAQKRSSEFEGRARDLRTHLDQQETQIKGLRSRLAFLDARIKAENEQDAGSAGVLDRLFRDPTLQVINVYAVSNKSTKPNAFCRILKVADAPSIIHVYRLTTGDFGAPDDSRRFQVWGMKLSMAPDSLGLLKPSQLSGSSVRLGELSMDRTSGGRWTLQLSDSKALNDVRYLLITEGSTQFDSSVPPVFWGYVAPK